MTNWDKQLSKHHVNTENNQLIHRQYQSHKNISIPKIADNRIKLIPIKESGEPLVDINLQNHARIKMMPKPDKPFSSPEQSSGLPAAPFVRISLYEKLKLLIIELDKLAVEFEFQIGQISLRIFEGLRDLHTQDQLFYAKLNEIKSLNPRFSYAQTLNETYKWASPIENNVPAHSTGGAVDIRLYDEKNAQYLNMGEFGAIWGQNQTAETFSQELSVEQISNRLYLLVAASKVNLVNYPYEYWHFSTGDRYATYWQQPRPIYAIYDSVKTII